MTERSEITERQRSYVATRDETYINIARIPNRF